MTETATFALREQAADFVSRDLGRGVRARLMEYMATVPETDRITILAAGVGVMTPSFVDEFFGRTASELGIEKFKSRFRLEGFDEDAKVLINKVVLNRLQLDKNRKRSNGNDRPAA